MSWIRYTLIGVIVLVVLFFLFLILFKPPPVAEGGCALDCIEFVNNIPATDFIDSAVVCARHGYDGCGIDKIIFDIAVWQVKCVCCNCEGGAEAGLGICQYGNIFLNAMGEMLGLCKVAV